MKWQDGQAGLAGPILQTLQPQGVPSGKEHPVDHAKTLKALLLFIKQSVLTGLSLQCVVFHNA
jgi:hypothetical protein